MFEKDYYEKIRSFIQSSEKKHFKFEDLTDDPEKLKLHLEHYREKRHSKNFGVAIYEDGFIITAPGVEFIPSYFDRLYQFIQERDNVRYIIEDLTDDPEKYLFHLKYYIDNKLELDNEVELNSLSESEIMYGATYSEFRVLEFFECRIRDQMNYNLPPTEQYTRPVSMQPETIEKPKKTKTQWNQNLQQPTLF